MLSLYTLQPHCQDRSNHFTQNENRDPERKFLAMLVSGGVLFFLLLLLGGTGV
jgi:hypothetical protein